MKRRTNKEYEIKHLSNMSLQELTTHLQTSKRGLSHAEANNRLETYGANMITSKEALAGWKIFLNALKDPFVLVLTLLMVVSLATKDWDAATVMFVMILASTLITFIQEYRAQKASIDLKKMIENTCSITRENLTTEIPMENVVPGDILNLGTGDVIPADALIFWAKDLFVNQSSLTGESLPVEKRARKKTISSIEKKTTADIDNLVFMGTDVLSGQAKAIILKTGQETIFGDIAHQASGAEKKTAFDQGLEKVSKLLLRMVLILFPLVFLINGLTKGDWSQAFFFAIAIAVGLTPEMLPMIVTSNLAKGATTLAKEKVIVKKLPAIQNLGGMDVLCTDKTGTITEDRVVLVQHLDFFGHKNNDVLDVAFMNAFYQTGWKNLMDIALINYYQEKGRKLPYDVIEKVDELPFDFERRRQSVAMRLDQHQLLITKGAVEEMTAVSHYVQINGKAVSLTDKLKNKLNELNYKLGMDGMRVLAVAIKKDVHSEPVYSVKDERDMTFIGFLCFLDPAKSSAQPAIKSLQKYGVAVKVLTGDNATVAQKVCNEVNIKADNYLLGTDLEELSDEELAKKVDNINLFAKLSPNQKGRIIEVLQEKGHTVGFMGDGINDAPALRKADVGISVDNAADITKDASSIILLEKSLDVLEKGVLEGRKVFSNMMKYIKITLSSNFGNVFSILVASVFLPFLPMLSLQLLIQNLIYDLSQLALPFDNVDESELLHPVKWATGSLMKFVVSIGPISSIFDILTFAAMWTIFGANTVGNQALFQTGWFAIGLTTQTLVVHLLRTKKLSLFHSRASLPLWFASLCALLLGALFLFTPLRAAAGFVNLPQSYWIFYCLVNVVYLLTTEIAKRVYVSLTNEWI